MSELGGLRELPVTPSTSRSIQFKGQGLKFDSAPLQKTQDSHSSPSYADSGTVTQLQSIDSTAGPSENVKEAGIV